MLFFQIKSHNITLVVLCLRFMLLFVFSCTLTIVLFCCSIVVLPSLVLLLYVFSCTTSTFYLDYFGLVFSLELTYTILFLNPTL